MRKNKEGFFGCPKCNCRIVYQFSCANVPIGILEKSIDDEIYVKTLSNNSHIYGCIYRCVDCGFEFNEPVWVSAECYNGQ